MKCRNCGKVIKDGSQFCDKCGTKVESEEPVMVYNQPASKKKNVGLIITIILLIAIIIALGIICLVLLLGGDKEESSNTKKDEIVDKDKKEEDNKKEDNKKEDNKKEDNKKEDNKKEDNKKDYSNNETFVIGDYTFIVPDGWKLGLQGDKYYIQNNECIIMALQYPLTYEFLKSNKDLFVDSLTAKGYEIDSFTTRRMDGKDYVLITGSLNGNSYGLMFCDLDSSNTIFLTISSVTLGEFNDYWFNYGSKLVSQAKK